MTEIRRPTDQPERLTGRDSPEHEGSLSAGTVRNSLAGARRAAAPYVTMTRIVFARLSNSRVARLGAVILASVALIATFADFLASELPIACRSHGVLRVLPNLLHPAALTSSDCAQLRLAHNPGDWVIEPLVAYGPTQPGSTGEALLPPLTRGHPFGSDALGRDVFARVVHGARTVLVLGLAGSAVLVALGTALGSLAGFFGGVVDGLVARAIESLAAIPTLLLVLVVEAIVLNPTTATLLWTIALTRWTELARLVRAEVLGALGQDYVAAARALGASPARVLWRHVLPNVIGPAIVAAAFGTASIVLVESAVDFLRAAPPDAVASWGETLGEARMHAGAWWLVVFPGLALLFTLIALNLIGEASRSALDLYPSAPKPAKER